jgi:hypothetical protein
MLSDIARTRPMRSPSHPKNTPPVAAPTRNTAMMAPNHPAALALPAGPSRSASAGPPISGNNPISKPSNIHPRRAAASAIQRPALDAAYSDASADVSALVAGSSTAAGFIG